MTCATVALLVGVGAALAGLVIGRATGRGGGERPRAAAAGRYECAVCGRESDDREMARDHATEAHAAIDETTWRDVTREVG